MLLRGLSRGGHIHRDSIASWWYKSELHRSIHAAKPPRFRQGMRGVPLFRCYSNQVDSATGGSGDVDFLNSKKAYGGHTTPELVRASLVFGMCAYDIILKNQNNLLRWSRALLGRRLWTWMMRKTVFGQFMVGDTQQELMNTAQNYSSRGMTPFFAFTANEVHGEAGGTLGKTASLEDQEEVQKYNYEKVLASLEVAADSSQYTDHRCKASGKITAIAHAHVIKKMNDHILRTMTTVMAGLQEGSGQKTQDLLQLVKEHASSLADHNLFHVVDGSEPSVESLLTNVAFLLTFQKQAARHGFQKGTSSDFTDEEMVHAVQSWTRMKTVGQRARELGVWFNWDAEQLSMQWAIESLVLDCMRLCNTEKVVITNTYQCYLRRTKTILLSHLSIARSEGFHFGGKIVRGGYMDEERRVSEQQGYPSPVNPTYEATTQMYYDVAELLLGQMRETPGDVMATFATHNAETVQHVIERCRDLNVPMHPESVSFAQLLGMRDYISFTLGLTGIPASKLLHYGEVEGGVAYLSRRLQENESGLPTSRLERSMCGEELKRRLLRRRS